MTIGFVVLLAVIAFVLRWLRWRRLSLALAITAAALLLIVGWGIPTHYMLAGLQDGFDTRVTTWGEHNAIVVLGGGNARPDRGEIEVAPFSYSRLVKAAELYQACKSQKTDCRIIPSGGDPQQLGTPEAQVLANSLYQLGVPHEDVLIENRSLNTWQNAQFSSAFFANNRFDRAFLVSSGIHLRRSLIYFAHFGIHAQAIRADYGNPDKGLMLSAFNILLTDTALHEYLGILRYHVYNMMGWNVKPADKPGVV